MSDSILLTYDGAVLDPDVPFLHADELAAVRGDGIFETLLVRGGAARNVRLHLDRLERSAKALDLPIPNKVEWERTIGSAARIWTERHGRTREGQMRLVYSRGRESAPVSAEVDDKRASTTGVTRDLGGATAYLTVSPVSDRVDIARRDGVRVITAARGFSIDLTAKAPWELLGAKTLSYATNMAALRYAAAQGADDVIYVSSEGIVLEGPRSTVVAVYDKTMVTTPPEYGVLPGTTAQAVFALAEKEGWHTEMSALRTPDLIQADSVWLVSSVTLFARVTSLNGYVLDSPLRPNEFPDLLERAILNA